MLIYFHVSRGAGREGGRVQALLSNTLRETLGIFDYLVMPKSYYGNSVDTQPGIPLPVIQPIFSMLPATEFCDTLFIE
jgi:hypothetical protein